MKPVPIIISVAVIAITLFVGYYFVVFLPKQQNQQDLVKHQASCLEMEKAIIKEQSVGITKDTTVSGQNYYNPIYKKCFVEINTNQIGKTSLSNTYLLYDAVEDHLLADCIIIDYFDSASIGKPMIYCTDDSQGGKGNENPQIEKSQFEALLTKYMGSSNIELSH